jgi:hypothetical protein
MNNSKGDSRPCPTRIMVLFGSGICRGSVNHFTASNSSDRLGNGFYTATFKCLTHTFGFTARTLSFLIYDKTRSTFRFIVLCCNRIKSSELDQRTRWSYIHPGIYYRWLYYPSVWWLEMSSRQTAPRNSANKWVTYFICSASFAPAELSCLRQFGSVKPVSGTFGSVKWIYPFISASIVRPKKLRRIELVEKTRTMIRGVISVPVPVFNERL